jgi:C4-dicarboxylate transporter DctQ subunit
MLKKMDKVLCAIEEVIIAVGLITSALILFINVVLRYFFQSGIVWAEEFTRYSIIWITFVGGSVAVRYGAHLSVSALLEVVNAKNKRLLTAIAYIISIIFTIFLFVYGTQNTLSIMATKQLTPSMEIPAYWINLAIPVGGFLLTLRFIQAFIKDVIGYTGKEAKQ